MIFNCILIFVGGYVSIVTIFAYDTYQDNFILREKIKKLEKEEKNE